jgi:hypothetical protein
LASITSIGTGTNKYEIYINSGAMTLSILGDAKIAASVLEDVIRFVKATIGRKERE